MPLQFTRPCWQLTAHAPDAHTCPAAHITPALPPLSPQPAVAPQLARLELGSTQMPPHSIKPGWQLTKQLPFEQMRPVPQVEPAVLSAALQLPLAPQCALLLAGSTQRPSHATVPWLHVIAHAPAVHTEPGSQAVPQPPQLAVSVCVSTHDAPHAVVVPSQLGLQAPCEQTSPAPQALPQLPQLLALLVVSTHALPHMVCVQTGALSTTASWPASDPASVATGVSLSSSQAATPRQLAKPNINAAGLRSPTRKRMVPPSHVQDVVEAVRAISPEWRTTRDA